MELDKKELSNYDRQVDIARTLFLKHDQKKMIHKFQLKDDETWIYVMYFSTPFRIHKKDGHIEEKDVVFKECRCYDTVMTIYDLLCYSKGEMPPLLSQEWTTLSSFVIGNSPSPNTFANSYALFFQNHLKAFQEALKTLGGIIEQPLARADITCRFYATPYFPILLQFWKQDEEFLPQLMILWDKNSGNFLHFETMFYLQGDLLQRIKNKMKE